MVCQEMRASWNTNIIQLSSFALLVVLFSDFQGCWSLNSEGLALLKFRSRVDSDPCGAFANWNPHDHDPCVWSGVHCLDGKVHMLDLNGYSLKGAIAPELGNLTHLISLVLSKNQFFGAIPKQLGWLTMLQVLDLRDNNLSGTIPAEIGKLKSLKHLLLCNNSFEGRVPSRNGKVNWLPELQFDENLTSAVAAEIGCVNRKFGHCILQSGLKPLGKAESILSFLKEMLTGYLNFCPLFNFGKWSLNSNADIFCDNLSSGLTEPEIIQPVKNLVNSVRRRLAEQSSNLAAASINNNDHVIALPSSRSSGSFPAVPQNLTDLSPSPPPAPPKLSQEDSHDASNSHAQSSSEGKSSNTWKYIVGISSGVFLLLAAAAILIICRSRAAKNIRPWKTGLSGQLQKAFITGVPKLNREELETACEDFSNIISTHDPVTVYKGTLSSGVEIAVSSTVITSRKDWIKRAEMAYRKKIDTLSRVNHKNFTNLIGYCEEDEPFVRMMVFEYAPNGTLSEHLHVAELEHLDWNARMRIIMGIAYCLQYMHGLNPPVAHEDLISSAIYLTDDYAAKVAEVSFWSEFISKSKNPGENEVEDSELPPLADPETNVYSFGMLLLEIISGKDLESEKEGPILNWAAQYLNDKHSVCYLIDPTLKSFKKSELDIICEVIQECIQQDARRRPTMEEITSKMREVLDISPAAATPRLSPLWWAELELLSVEAP